jgi:hypothetical protein
MYRRIHLTKIPTDGLWRNLLLEDDQRPIDEVHGVMRIGERVEFRFQHGGREPDLKESILGSAIAKIIVPYAEVLRKEKEREAVLKSDEQVRELVARLLASEEFPVKSILANVETMMDVDDMATPHLALLEDVHGYDGTTAMVDTTAGWELHGYSNPYGSNMAMLPLPEPADMHGDPTAMVNTIAGSEYVSPCPTSMGMLPPLGSANMHDATTLPAVNRPTPQAQAIYYPAAPPPLESMNVYYAPTPRAETSTPPPNRKAGFVCAVCSQSFKSKAKFKMHRKMHREYSSRSLEQHPCPVKDCNYLYTHDDIKKFHAHLLKKHDLTIGLGDGGKALLYNDEGAVVGEMATDGSSISMTGGENVQTGQDAGGSNDVIQISEDRDEKLHLAKPAEGFGAGAELSMQDVAMVNGDGTNSL